MNEAQQIKIYGETIEEMRGALLFTDINDPSDVIGYAMGILSDAQQVMARNPERAHQFINKSKYFMSVANQIVLKNRLNNIDQSIAV